MYRVAPLLLLIAALTGCTRAGFSPFGPFDGGGEGSANDLAPARSETALADLGVSSPQPDPTFGEGGSFRMLGGDTTAQSKLLLLDSQGRIVLAGQSKVIGENLRVFAARLLPNGSFDPTFNGGSPVLGVKMSASEHTFALALTANDEPIIGGGWDELPKRPYLVSKLRVDGSLDPTFGEQGIATFGRNNNVERIYGLLMGNDGEITFAGVEEVDGAADGVTFGRLQVNGALADTGVADNIGIIGSVGAFPRLAAMGNKQIIAARNWGSGAGYNVLWLARLENGALDPSFGQNGTLLHDLTGNHQNAYNMLGDTSGRLYVCLGTAAVTAGITESLVIRLRSDGSLDTSYGEEGLVKLTPRSSSRPQSLVLDDRGRLLVIGDAQASADGPRDIFVQRLMEDGSIDSSFTGSQSAYLLDLRGDDWVRESRLDSQGRLLITGWENDIGDGGGWVLRLLLPN